MHQNASTGSGQVQAAATPLSTSDFRGVNWADQRDNFVNGVLYPSGLSSSDSYSSAATVADRVVGQMYSITGANTVRMPINEPTVSQGWGTYTGAIDKALTKGKVILAYWAYNHSRPVSTSAFYAMWDKVVAKYGSNPNACFEVINEPGLGTSDLTNFYNAWLNRYSGVPRARVILDGTSGGNYVRFKNPVTGLYLDGMGRTSNGSDVGQQAGSTATSQQWSVLTGVINGNDVRIRNRATGLYLDGMGRTGNGSNLGQNSGSTSTDQQWRIVAAD